MKKILFDLDGTLTNPRLGISRCIRYAMEKLGMPCPADLDWCIGPPLQESFSEMLGRSPDRVEKAIKAYRERFSAIGMYENEVYSGIIQMLEELRRADFKLFVATSKPRVFAEKIVVHFGLEKYLVEVYGSELDGTRTDKADLINYVVNELSGSPDMFVMVGDRKHDLIGAHRNNMSAIGVLWGYGSRDELQAVPSLAIQDSPVGLSKFLIAQSY